MNWAAHSLFLITGNQPPVATFTASCPAGQLKCTFDSTGTNDPDGSIASYSWDFGDGQSGAGTAPSHTYAGTGPETVVLTVTDNGGAVTSYTSVVNVVNASPVAHLSVTCPTGTLKCTLDAQTSTDDGTIAGYQWDFGDGSSLSTTNPTITHAYAAQGTYLAKVTVTDNLGASGVDSASANPTAGAHSPNIAFRSSASSAGVGSSASVTVPGNVVSGDVLVVVETVNSGSATSPTPAGWTLEGTKTNGSAMLSNVYAKVATSGDAGSPVAFTFGSSTKSALTLSAYSGASTTDLLGEVASATDSGTATHTTPTVNVATTGSWVLSYWADKSSTTPTSWTTPAGVTSRESAIPSQSSGAIAAQLADSAAALPSGSYGGLGATVNTTSTKGVTWTITIHPATTTTPPAGIAFRSSASSAGVGSSASVTVPGNVVSGDVLVVVETVNSGSATSPTPAGWTLEGTKTNGSAMLSNVYAKVATSGDAGSPVAFTFGSSTKSALTLSAYSGASTTDLLGEVASATDSGTATHTTPTVNVATTGSWVLSYWADKSSTTPTSWTTPAGVTSRESAIPSQSSGAIAAQLADSAAALPSGSYGGLGATVNTTSTKGVTWTITVNPGS